jgi:hypothetical protein
MLDCLSVSTQIALGKKIEEKEEGGLLEGIIYHSMG